MSYLLFSGFVLTFAIIGYLIWDMERKRERIGRLASRVEHLSSGKEKLKIRHLRRLNLSVFFHERVLRDLGIEIEELEHNNGLETAPAERQSKFFSKKMQNMEERVARLEEVLGS